MKTTIQRMDISAAPGTPSTLWVNNNSGKVYRKLKQALNDKGEEVNPDDIEIKTSWLKRNRKALIAGFIGAVLAVAIVWVFLKYAKHIKL